jgi:hypothetical protein
VDAAPLITALGGILTGLAVAITGHLRNRDDRKRGVRADERDDLTARGGIWSQILDDVQEHQVAPLRAERDDLRQQLDTLWTRYWVAIEFVRRLLAWIGRRTPPDADVPDPVPDTPTEIRKDL